MRLLALIFCCVFALPAFAQAPSQLSIPQAWQTVRAAQTGLGDALTHLQDGLQGLLDENQKLQKALSDERGYWAAWCSEKPGCSTETPK